MHKRSLRRINVKDGTCLLMKNGFFRGTIENISLGGLFVKSGLEVNVMDRLNVSIFLPSDSGGIDFEADVVATRIDNGGIAFKFHQLDYKEFWTLQSYLHQAIGPSLCIH